MTKSTFGPRSKTVLPPSTDELSLPRDSSTRTRNEAPDLIIANSRLLVVRAFILGSNIEGKLRALGLGAAFSEHKWSDALLTKCREGAVDIAIYNNRAVERYLNATENADLIHGPVVCHSMGGRNFSMVSHRDHPLVGASSTEFMEVLSGTTIYVGKSTDRYLNLLDALEATEEALERANIRIVNMTDPSIEVLREDPTALICGGQNARFEARISKDFVEVLDFDSLPARTQESLRSRAANCLVYSSRASALIGDLEAFGDSLVEEFRSSTSSVRNVKKLVELLTHECEFDEAPAADRSAIAQHVLFETYRIGDPVW